MSFVRIGKSVGVKYPKIETIKNIFQIEYLSFFAYIGMRGLEKERNKGNKETRVIKGMMVRVKGYGRRTR